MQPQDAASQLSANLHGVTEGILKTNQDNQPPSDFPQDFKFFVRHEGSGGQDI
jgi:hypothetical protein